MSRKRVTIRDVAEKANVSSSTVSNVINNNDYHVSEETKLNVLAAIRELGYRPPSSARSIMSKRITSLAIVISNATGPHVLADPLTAEVMRGITEYARPLGFQVILHVAPGWDPLHYEQTFKEQRAESAIVLGSVIDDPLVKRLHADAIPFVTINYEGTHHPNVGPDHRKAGQLLVRHLLAAGRKQLAVVTAQHDTFPARDLLAGILQAMFTAGLTLQPHHVVAAPTTQSGGVTAAEKLLATSPTPDAIITGDDVVASGVLRALATAGVSVPGQCAVIGYGNSPATALTDPPLTSVELSAYAVGRQAMRWLSAHLRDDEVEPVDLRLPVDLVIRQSG